MPIIDEILQVKIPQHAFSSPFLMHCVLGLSAQHLQHLNQDISPARALAYRAKAFEGYRRAVEEARPETFPALLACSLLLCGLASEVFRDADAKPLYIIDWMVVWRGIGLILSIIKPQILFTSGMAILFSRPPIDLNASAMSIPNNLLFMITSIRDGDADFPDVETYYATLKYLGSLYHDLETGYGPTLSLRIITWFTFLPHAFVELARQKRPRALVIIAHYLCFVKLCQDVWWLAGIADKEIRDISDFLGEDWHPLLRVPRGALHTEGMAKLGKLILDNHTWEPEHGDRRSMAITHASVDDAGDDFEFDGSGLVRSGTGAPALWNQVFPGREPESANFQPDPLSEAPGMDYLWEDEHQGSGMP